MNHTRFIVITGGPGSGKTTLLETLGKAGHACMPEAGRAVIQAQTLIDGPALPWRDRALFAELMLSQDIASHQQASRHTGAVFFDRGIPDIIGYLRLSGLHVPSHAQRAATCFRYRRRVFVAPPWKEIYQQDTERRQDFEEAVRTCREISAAYAVSGYELIQLPFASPSSRADFILEDLDRDDPVHRSAG